MAKTMSKGEIRKLLQEEGLSENAARVYLALITSGSGNLSTLSSAAKLHPQSVKNALTELDKFGLLSRINHKLSRSLFQPAPPYVISQRIKSRYDRYVEALPQLQVAYRAKTSRFSSVYRGAPAFREHLALFVSSLPDGATLSILGHPGERLSAWLGSSYEQIEKVRIAKKIKKNVIISYRDTHAFREQLFVREKDSSYRKHPAIEGPLVQFVSESGVLYHFADQSEPTTHIILSDTHARGALRLFASLWKEATKV